jgi:hypothetical protein
MPYKVQFLGLVCFYRDREGLLAMLPDGRKPGDGIDPHHATIAIDPDAILESEGWNGRSHETGMFRLPSCRISIDGMETEGVLDASAHAGRLPRLGEINPDFRIDPETAQTIATVLIRQGKLTAYLVPGGTAVMSELEVLFDGDIRITVTPRRGSPRYLLARAGSEIAITNTAGDYRRVHDHENHFRIYEKLSAQKTTLTAPRSNSNGDRKGMTESPSQHFLFTEGISMSLTESCSNTGCCP